MGAFRKIGKAITSVLDMGQGAAAEAADKAQKAQEAAAAEQAKIAQQTADNQAQLNAINQNYATDLTQTNPTQVVAGGTADTVAADTDSKKKIRTAGLSSTLGINV